jgi:HEAT repeat protein
MPLIRKPTAQPIHAESRPATDVLTALNSRNVEERWAAAREAAQLSGAETALAAALQKETDARVREAMFTSLARAGTSESVGALVAFLRSDDAALRAGALDVLRSRSAAVRDYLPNLLADADADVRVLSCELVRSLPSKDATQLLGELLERDTEANVCAAAIDVLAEAGDADAVVALDACASRFERTHFLQFAIEIARQRIISQSTALHE